MQIDLDTLSPSRAYHLLIQAVVPRPIAWVLSGNADGSLNLAPFSFFNAVCADPPILLLSIGSRPDGSDKDTRRNIRERGHFVVHIPQRELAFEVSDSSRPLPPGESEVARQGLATVAFGGFPLPRLADCRVAFACDCHSLQALGPQLLVFGRIRHAWLDDGIVQADARGRLQVDAQALDPLARLGGDDYSVSGGTVTVPRPWL